METGVRDLKVVFFKANSSWFNDICSKDLSNRPIWALLNTHSLDMILQVKYMPIVMNPPGMTENPRNAMVWATPYLKNEFGDPRFFYVFSIIIFYLQSKFQRNLYVGNFGRERP